MLKISDDGKIQFTWKAISAVFFVCVSVTSTATWEWYDVRNSQHRSEDAQKRIEGKLDSVVTLQDLVLHDLQMQVLNPSSALKYPDAQQYFHGAQRMTETQQKQ